MVDDAETRLATQELRNSDFLYIGLEGQASFCRTALTGLELCPISGGFGVVWPEEGAAAIQT